VVPCLRSVIEDSRLFSFSGCFGDDLLQWKVRKLRSSYKLVQVIEIPIVMFAVVEANSICGDYGVQSVISVGQRG